MPEQPVAAGKKDQGRRERHEDRRGEGECLEFQHEAQPARQRLLERPHLLNEGGPGIAEHGRGNFAASQKRRGEKLAAHFRDLVAHPADRGGQALGVALQDVELRALRRQCVSLVGDDLRLGRLPRLWRVAKLGQTGLDLVEARRDTAGDTGNAAIELIGLAGKRDQPVIVVDALLDARLKCREIGLCRGHVLGGLIARPALCGGALLGGGGRCALRRRGGRRCLRLE